MPLLHSAIKKLAVDRRRERENRRYRDAYAAAVKLARKQPTVKNLKSAFSALDRAAKKKVIHTNKADRLKSRLAHSLK